MAKRTNRKNEVAQNVLPAETTETQQPGGYNTRVCVPAPMPIRCPHCGGSKTTAANGVHYNLHYGTRYEHRVCPACGFTFTAARRMTKEELAAKVAK